MMRVSVFNQNMREYTYIHIYNYFSYVFLYTYAHVSEDVALLAKGTEKLSKESFDKQEDRISECFLF